ncbi:MAG: cytochrome c oxidase accessory protein CcoG [Bacteroidetes bacterium]|nr:MAG: cytochrome c oxidase accessory protein CcoG [Bacteroidota bacterium]
MSASAAKKKSGQSLAEWDPEAFRDSIATVDAQGKRKWIFPKKPEGRLYNARKIVAYLCIALLFAGPFIKINGQPLLLLNIIERKFVIMGLIFWPQDFHLFMLAMVTFFVFIVLFTVIFGRIWCGWTCPQTIFMEMVFRRIEYWIEGDAAQQRRLSEMPWNEEKILKRGGKLFLFALVSLVIGNAVMAYIIGIEELEKAVLLAPTENWGSFSFVLIFSALFFFVFTYLREQACIAICPYGRLQGVLLSKESLVVSYDHVRGEPRGRMTKTDEGLKTAEGNGDCIDCKLCVAVCPTGIDIRHGTQLECINCTACMDGCDSIMDKVGKARGLVRIASHTGIETKTPFKVTPRIIAYSAVLLLLATVLVTLLASRSSIETTILRAPGTLFQTQEEGWISNMYTYEIVNKTMESYPIEVRVADPEGGRVRIVGQQMVVPPQELAKGVFFLDLPKEKALGQKHKIQFEIWSGDKKLEEVSTNFLGPL